MQTKLIFIFLFGLSSFLCAQDQLRIEYELIVPEENFRTPDLPKNIEIKIPKRYFELILTSEESIWRSIERINNDQNEEKGVRGAKISFPPTGSMYKNLKSKTKTEEVKSFSENYLVKDSLTIYDWQLTKETKEVLNIEVQKATFYNKAEGF